MPESTLKQCAASVMPANTLCSFEGAKAPYARGRGDKPRPWARRKPHNLSGGDSRGVTPDPIPNSVVKPSSADGTWPGTARESRSPPGNHYTAGPHDGSGCCFSPVAGCTWGWALCATFQGGVIGARAERPIYPSWNSILIENGHTRRGFAELEYAHWNMRR